MTQLSVFTDEQIDLIVSVPYRIGMNVSYAEDEDGELDDEREMRALEACLSEMSKHEGHCDLSREIASQILQSKDKWSAWSEGVFNVAPLCEKAVAEIKTQAGKDDAKDYVAMCLEIASAVAQAYGEFGDGAHDERGFFGKAMGRIVGGFSGMNSDDANHPMNVSAAEDSAIAVIKAALQKNI